MSNHSSSNPTETALLAAVRANLADSLPRLVYADWLDEYGDPHRWLLAAAIRVECELARTPQDDPRGAELIRRLIEVGEPSDCPLGGWEYAADLERIRRKMDALRAADPERTLFAIGHEYSVQPPVREADLLALEMKLGFLLPAEYRAFLLRVGNGRMGPAYGLIPLDVNQDPAPLRRPFPFTRAAAFAEIARPAEWEDSPLRFTGGNSHDGHLHLSELGCGGFDLLAISGDARGGVWDTWDMVAALELTPDGTPHTFLTWYEAWLDDSLKPETLAKWRPVGSG